MAYKYTEDDVADIMTMEIRYDDLGRMIDSKGRVLGPIRPIPPHDVNKPPQYRKLKKKK
tara:strand:- start:21 stop:197 length:177 start_codon:yes stop_codon:yes gene_type:complete